MEGSPLIANTDPVVLLAEVLAALEDELSMGGRIPVDIAAVRACVEANTIPDFDPSDAAALAHAFIRVSRMKKRAAANLKAANGAIAQMVDPILDHMKHNRWPTSGKVDGANLHRKLELYASPAETTIMGETFHDHGALSNVIRLLDAEEPDNNWSQLLPSNINGQSLAATFREYLKNHDFTIDEQLKPVTERLAIAGCPPALIAAAKITEKHTVNANGL